VKTDTLLIVKLLSSCHCCTICRNKSGGSKWFRYIMF